jgi:hypothetical protein
MFDPETQEPYGFGYDAPPTPTAGPQSYMGFLDVAGVGQPTEEFQQEPVQLIEPLGDQDQAPAPQPEGGMAGGGEEYPSEAAIERRLKLAETLMGQQQEVNHPMQAVANAVSKIGGAWMERKAEREREAIEKQRRELYRKALLGGDTDLNALIETLSNSPRFEDVDRAMQLRVALAMRGRDPRKPPETRTYDRGGEKVTEQWNPETEQFEPLATAPRGRDGEGGPRSYQRYNQILLEGETRARPARFNPEVGPEYLGDDGQWRPIPPNAVEVTPTANAPASKTTVAKLDNEIIDMEESIRYIEDYAKTRGGARQGLGFMADEIMGSAKTLFGRPLTPEELAADLAKGEFSTILGLFRTPVLGPGVMTQADIEFLQNALGKYPNAFQNKEVLSQIIDMWVQRRQYRLRELRERRKAMVRGGTSAEMPEPEAPPERERPEPEKGGGAPKGLPPKEKRPKGMEVTKGGKTYVWTGTGWREKQ